MGGFGEAVASLVETYTKCLALLKGFRQEGDLNESQSRLDKSLRSNRARVRRVYSSRLSKSGAPLEKGDTAARTSLRRIIKKLTTAMSDVVHTLTGRKRHSIDYDALLALSNASRLDAIRTINDLSSRVGSKGSSSRNSVVSSRSSRSKLSTKRTPERGRRKTERKDSSSSRLRAQARASSRASSKKQRGHDETEHNRISMLTLSSDSTKLGEVRHRYGRDDLPWTPSQPTRVAYPLYYDRPKMKPKKKWWSIF